MSALEFPAVGAPSVVRPSFAAAYPGFMTAMKNVGHAAAAGARVAGKVAAAKTGKTAIR